MRQAATHQRFFDPAEGFRPSRGSGDAAFNHLLLAIGRAISPPVVHMRNTFQPVRVIVVQPDLVSTIDEAQWGSETPRLLPFATHAVDGVRRAESAWQQRDTAVNRVAPAPIQRAENRSDNRSHRKLFTDPGQWRVVTWGEFKEILAPQLAHPERLRDTYRLPCYVQVVETNRDVAIEELAKESSTPDGRPKPLYLLTDELATKLELTSLLPSLPARAPEGEHRPNVLSANQRVFRLLVANDPTVDVGSVTKRSAESKTATKPGESETRVAESAPSPVLKTSIPTSFVKEWEFKISREEAVYDMNTVTLFTSLQRLVSRLRLLKQRREFRKWQVLLTGKNCDEQLWSVRPPENMLDHPFVRQWVTKTAQLGGYDAGTILVEWEIFWRRKGLR